MSRWRSSARRAPLALDATGGECAGETGVSGDGLEADDVTGRASAGPLKAG